jgi:hypothetical protein
MTQRARYELKQASLANDFGRDYALRTFNLTLDQIESLVGRYTKGKRKGELRGAIVWGVVTVGGWVREPHGGFVVRPGLRYGHGIVDSWSGKVFLGVDLTKEGHAAAMRYAYLGDRGVRLQEQVEQEERERQAKHEAWKAEYLELYPALMCAGLDQFTAVELALEETGAINRISS